MNYAICHVAAAPIRKDPAHRSEMVNQLLFGETMVVLEKNEEWWKIRSCIDNYEGWLTHHLVQSVEEMVATSHSQYVTTDLVSHLRVGDHLIHLPMGASLTGFSKSTGQLWLPNMVFEGSFRDLTQAQSWDLVEKVAHSWINAPYLWGGKTLMGVDCSGLVQTVFKVGGVKLLRDASQQQQQGLGVTQLQDARPGDLAFFDNDKGKVIHVGIILSGDRIIHASGKVRLDALDESGIMNHESAVRTHHLHSIRRVIE